MPSRDPYFDSLPERQALLWASAVRCQLARWEPLVAKHALSVLEPNMTPRPLPATTMRSEEFWQGEVERHMLVIAARNLIKAIELLDHPPIIEPTLRAELIETRDLVEHWTENMPVFNVKPRPRQPGYRSGKDFSVRNPERGPYCWWSWDTERGPLLTPNVSAKQLRRLVDETIKVALTVSPDMAEYVSPMAPTAFREPNAPGEWWWPEHAAAQAGQL